MAGRIFISYRREDTRGFSLAIFNYLATQFGADEIFIDVDSIAPGEILLGCWRMLLMLAMC